MHVYLMVVIVKQQSSKEYEYLCSDCRKKFRYVLSAKNRPIYVSSP
jgi:hypothetical protein